jgi:hypothetical protein
MPATAEFEQRDNPYRALSVPQESFAAGGATLDSLEDQLHQLQAFVGPRARYYLRKWLPKLEDPEAGDVSMNWAAFFLGAWWMAYRKMYRNMFILMGLMMCFSFIQQVVSIKLIQQPWVPAAISLIVNVLTMFVVGLCGNAWYLAHARRNIDALRGQGYNDEHLLYALSRKGGTNFWAGVGIVFLSSMLMGVVVMIGVVIAAVAMGGMPH